jgi:hypothetical protein
MSAHPSRCTGCRGSGWTDGPPIIRTVAGRPYRYTTVKRCTHDWWHDDTSYDPYHDELLERDHPRAQAAFARGYAQGLADLDAIQNGEPDPLTRTKTA